MILSKNVNNKKCAPKLIFFNEKKWERFGWFWYRKLTLKVKGLGDFALFDTSPLTQFSKFNNFLWVCWFSGKSLSNFVPPVWKLHNPYCHKLITKGMVLIKSSQMWVTQIRSSLENPCEQYQKISIRQHGICIQSTMYIVVAGAQC